MPMPQWSLTGVPPEPCEYCQHRARCGAENLACYTFALYTGSANELRSWWHKTSPNKPSREIYAAIFSGETDDAQP